MVLWVYGYAGDALAQIGMVDSFYQLRMVRRYDEPGVMDLIVPYAGSGAGTNHVRIAPDMILWPEGQSEAYMVETCAMEEGESGDVLAVTARTCSALLDRRYLHKRETFRGKGGEIIKWLFERFGVDMIHNVEEPERFFPDFHWDFTHTQSLGHALYYETQPISYLEAVQNLCKAAELGFATEFSPASRMMVLHLYEGRERSEAGGAYGQVVFDAAYENLPRATYTHSVRNMANMAYVLGEANAEGQRKMVKVQDDFAGHARYEVVIDSGLTSITDALDEGGTPRQLTDAEYTQLLSDYGRERLAQYKRVQSIEGEIAADTGLFQYGRDYALGDVVLVRIGKWDLSLPMRVKEVEALYDGGMCTTRVLVGDRMPTLLGQIRRL